MSRPGVGPGMLTALIASLALAQPEEVVVPLTPEIVFAEMREVYAEGPWAERVTATLMLESGDERRDWFVLRVSPTPEGGVEMLRLEAGPLTLFADAERTVIEHDAVAERVVVAGAIIGDARAGLRELLPAVILPQLDILSGDRAFALDDAPIPAVTWHTAELSDATGHPFVTLAGSTDVGDSALIVDGGSLRLHTCVLPVLADEPMRLVLEFRPIAIGDSWAIQVGDREEVGTLAELMAPPSADEVEPTDNEP